MKKIIAYYLPQFHEVEENNKWWGPGFTEWTMLRKAKKYYKSQIIRKPTALGYYDLSEPSVIERQYSYANKHGVSAFCLWTYWFGNGEMLLQKPLENLLKYKLQVQYCIAWANHSWWNKKLGRLLKEQKYLGENDYKNFFKYMLPHFKSDNYFKVDGKPIVTVFDPKSIPDLELFISLWNKLAKENELEGIFFIAEQMNGHKPESKYFDAYLDSSRMFENRNFIQKVREKLVRRHNFTFLGPIKYSYSSMIGGKWREKTPESNKEIPVIFAGWDTTIRHGNKGVILDGFKNVDFRENVNGALHYNKEQQLVFLKSWNEWAEGNTIEPDDYFGEELAKIIKEELSCLK
ncbi:TPA: glycoside hydrolase family 99-like domain-containing protein [Escherichia albertii]